MKELWKPFRHGKYLISNIGRVKSVRANKIMKYEYANGYLTVQTCIDYRKKHHYIHRLVAKAFIGPCPLGKEVNHKDLNKLNPMWTNLEYKTRKKNLYHALNNGVDMLFARTRDTGHPGAILTSKQVCTLRKRFATGKYTRGKLSRKFGVTRNYVNKMLR